jgi:virulence-associated protein VagC
MNLARITNKSGYQFVRLPEECRFAGKEVGVAKFGEIVVLYSPKKRWNILEESLREFSDDFAEAIDRPRRQRCHTTQSTSRPRTLG